MNINLVLLFLSWLVHTEIDYNNRVFVRELQTAFKVEPNNLQKMKIREFGDQKDFSGQFFVISEPECAGYAYVGRVNSCRAGGCSNDQGMADGFAEFFDYFILYDGTGKIMQVRVFNYQASHGHGITSRGWLRQFIGYEGDEKLEPGKNVDAVSGATISVRAIAEDIESKTVMLKNNLIHKKSDTL